MMGWWKSRWHRFADGVVAVQSLRCDPELHGSIPRAFFGIDVETEAALLQVGRAGDL